MGISSTAGIAASWAATRVDAADQAIQTARLKDHAEAEQTPAERGPAVTEAQRPPPAPPGQGLSVDRQA
jgi:hypothetical protein